MNINKQTVRSVRYALFVLVVLFAAGAGADVLVDNGDAGTSYTGACCSDSSVGWKVSTNGSFVGADYLHTWGSYTYTWEIPVTEPGRYEVSVSWSPHESRGVVRYEVLTDAGTSSVEIDQAAGTGVASLGIHEATGLIIVTAHAPADTTQSASVDAVRAVVQEAVPNMQVSWDANPPDDQVTGYRVYLDGEQAASTAQTRAEMLVEPGDHVVEVTAVNAGGESPRSTPVGFSIAAPPPPPPATPIGVAVEQP